MEKAGESVILLDARQCKKPRKMRVPTRFEYLERYYNKDNGLFLNYKHFGMDHNEIASRAVETNPDIIAISFMFTPYEEEAMEVAGSLKKALPNRPIIAGGHHATVAPESLLNSPNIDYVIKGEGENILPQLISDLSSHNKLIDNLEDRTRNLDSLPFPARHLLDPGKYTLGGRKYTMILTSRGCPHSCSFCSIHTICGHEHRKRNIDNVLAEIDECVEKHNIEIFDLQDDNLLFEKDRIKILLENIISRYNGKHIDLLASNGLNVAHLDAELLKLMKRAGFRKLDIALGTGNVPARTNLKRPETLEQYENILFDAEKLGLATTTYIILGIPTQPIAEMRSSIKYLMGKNTLIAPSIFYNVPGMPIFDEMKNYEYLHENKARRGSTFNYFGNDFKRDDIFSLFKMIRLHNLHRQGL